MVASQVIRLSKLEVTTVANEFLDLNIEIELGSLSRSRLRSKRLDQIWLMGCDGVMLLRLPVFGDFSKT